MSSLFQNGADCGPINPLSNLIKQQSGASTSNAQQLQQQQQFQPSGSSARQAVFGNGPSGGAMEEGLKMGRGGGPEEMWNMGAMRNGLPDGAWHPPSMPHPSEFHAMERAFNAPAPSQMISNGPPTQIGADWTASFNAQQSVGPQLPAMTASMPVSNNFAPMQPFQSMYPMGMGLAMGGMPTMGMPAQLPHPGMYGGPQQIEGKGKGKMVELSDENWEKEFEKISGAKASKSATINAVKDGDDLIDLAKMEATQKDDEAFLSGLQTQWDRVKKSMLENEDSYDLKDLAKWEAENGGKFADLDGDFSLNDFVGDHGLYGQDFRAPQNLSTDYSPDKLEAVIKESIALDPYPFATNNPFSTISAQGKDPFEEGQRLLAEGATFKVASQAFEAACQEKPDRAEAWAMLGTVWAADEKEELARMALERAVDLGSKESWLGLAISYVNEGQDYRAMSTLERWLQLSYPTINAPPINSDTAQWQTPWEIQDRLTKLYLEAARMGAAKGNVDPDVQVGLGVLFYSAGEFEKARDCFEAALGVKPDDWILWNRLGATLANGGNPEMAIDAYRKALDLRPTFTRAIYNLGVACLNISCYREAAEHLLAALELQQRDGPGAEEYAGAGRNLRAGKDDGSLNLWNTLRKTLIAMGRNDLAEKAVVGGDINFFRGHFEF